MRGLSMALDDAHRAHSLSPRYLGAEMLDGYKAYDTPCLKYFLDCGPFGARLHGLIEAAVLDHCSRFQIFWRIALPLSLPSIGATGLFAFMLSYSEYIFSLVLSYERAAELTQISSSYRYVLGKIKEALGPLVGEIELAGTSDLASAGRKFSGNSQQRKRNFLLHHGTLLYAFNLEQVGGYLKHPARQPDYRRNRGHADFLMNLPLPREAIEQQLRETWQANEPCHHWPADRVQQLMKEKYSQESWIRRR